jgi:hypothetical protein
MASTEHESDQLVAVFFAVVLTLACTGIFAAILFDKFSMSTLAFLLIYPIVHILIGRLLVGLVLWIFAGVDSVFVLTDQPISGWSKHVKIIHASLWPITFLPCFVFGVLALVFGLVFKKLF